jgi:hypothetical protein
MDEDSRAIEMIGMYAEPREWNPTGRLLRSHRPAVKIRPIFFTHAWSNEPVAKSGKAPLIGIR